MSKTYRRTMLQIDCGCGASVDTQHAISRANRWGVPPDRTCWCEVRYDYYSKRNWKRDRENWWKPNKSFKEVSKKAFRAKVKQAMVQRKYNCMPVLKKTDVWDWN